MKSHYTSLKYLFLILTQNVVNGVSKVTLLSFPSYKEIQNVGQFFLSQKSPTQQPTQRIEPFPLNLKFDQN